MTNEAMNTCDSGVGGASGEDAMSAQQVRPPVSAPCDWSTPLQVYPDSKERFPKPCRHLPSIVVEPMDGGDVESGELRWPPDDVSDDVIEEQQQTEGAEPQELLVGGV